METWRLPIGAIVIEGPSPSFWNWVVRSVLKKDWPHVWLLCGARLGVEAAKGKGVVQFDAFERFKQLEEGRAFLVLDTLYLTDEERLKIKDAALAAVGRPYDIWNAIFYGLFRSFWNDGPAKLICSRLVTASYWDGIGLNVFKNRPDRSSAKGKGLQKGWCAPHDFIDDSLFRIIVSSDGWKVRNSPAVEASNPWADRYPHGAHTEPPASAP